MTGQLSIRAFGGLVVSLNGHRLTDFHSRKDAALLLYLARTRRLHPRETLAELLWPNRSQRQAMSNLRRTLHSLRQTLPQHVIITRYDCGMSDMPCWLDVTEFETVLTSITSSGIKTDEDALRLNQAMQLYQGDFLAGFAIDSAEFEEWVLLEREYLRRSAIEVLDMLVDWSLESRAYADGIAWASDLLKLDPLRELTHQHLMRLYTYTGERTRALTQYNTLYQLLQDELSIEPKIETRQLYDQIQAGDELAVGSPSRDIHAAKVRERTTSNLPAKSTPFVGRTDELAQLTHLLGDPSVRLVTLLGPGGMGKTRLALETAENQRAHFSDGVYFVPLAPLSDPAHMVLALADAVDFPIYQEGESRQQLLDFFHEKTILLLLDSFEQVLEGTALVADILAAAPDVKLLVTSRERLNVSSETALTLRGLDVPDQDASEDFTEHSAVELFIQGARRARPTFEPEADDWSQIARICRLVAGMPLGILLAAAWIELLSPHEIAAELARSLDFLKTQLRDMPERHRSIRAVFESTWAQLSQVERDIFKRLSVFRGGFTREAVHTIARADLPMLMALVHKSLVQLSSDTGRYDIHDLLREYAREKLEESGEAAALQDAHMRYFLELLSRREADLKGRGQMAALDEIAADFENVRVAWEWAVAHRLYAFVGPAVESMYWFCIMRSRYPEGKDLFGRARDVFAPLPSMQPLLVWGQILSRWVWLHAGDLSPSIGNRLDEYRDHIEQALATARYHKQLTEVAFCLGRLGWLDFYSGLTSALAYWEENLALNYDANDQFYAANTLAGFSYFYYRAGALQESREYARQSAAIRREIGDAFGLTESLAMVGHFTDDPDEKERAYNEARALATRLNHAWHMVNILLGMGSHALATDDLPKARMIIEQALEITTERNIPPSRAWTLTYLSLISFKAANYDESKHFAEQSRSFFAFDTIGFAVVDARLACAYCGLQDFLAAKQHLQSGVRYLATTGYQTWLAQDLLIAAAAIAAHDADPERAAQLVGRAEIQSSIAPASCPLLDNLIDTLKTELGDERYATAFDYGTTLDLDTVVVALMDELA